MMKKLTYSLILLLSITFLKAQNAFQSAQIISINKADSENYGKIFNELAKYVKSLQGKPLTKITDTFKVKARSNFLNDYVVQLISNKNHLLSSARNYNAISGGKSFVPDEVFTALGVKKDKQTTFQVLVNKINNLGLDSVFLKNTTLNKDSLLQKLDELALKEFFKTAKSKTEQQASELINGFNRQMAANGTSNQNINNVFEIQTVSAAKNGIKLPSESDIIDALAIFLVNRVKEESVIAFVDRVNNNIDKLQPLPCLFKNTTKELADYSPGQAAQFGSLTQKAIALDLAQMPDNIINCSFCGSENDVKTHADFTSFFNDIAGGVDLITNITYYAEKENPSDKNFKYVLQLLNFVNKYYSNIYQKGEVTQTWISPELIDNTNDSVLKLSLALVYEKDQIVFDEFLKNRFNINGLNEFFSKTDTFAVFKTNFKKMLYSLHRLDSYWQSHKISGKSVVDMPVYKRKIEDVFACVHTLMNYPKKEYALENNLYKTYLKAKEAVSERDIQSIVYYSQQLLDILSCYQINMPLFRLPNFELKNRKQSCIDTSYASRKQIATLKGDSGIKINEIELTQNLFTNPMYMTKLSQEVICHNSQAKCNWFNWSFNHYKTRLKSLADSALNSKGRTAMDLKFQPWLHPFMMTFHCKEWKLAVKLKEIRKIHQRQITLKNNPEFACYMLSEQQLKNKNSFGGTRREVSQLLNFFTDVSKSKDGKQLSQVIEKYAEPAQSYRIKRFNNFSCDINAYPGLYVAVETRAGLKKRDLNGKLINEVLGGKDTVSSLVTGITAPIGLSFSWAGRVKFNCNQVGKYPAYINRRGVINSFKGGCFTTSIMLIDIGAVLSYRFSHDTSQALPKEVNFSQVVAPGLYLGYGLPNLPLVINAGLQYVPQLRNFDNEGGKLFDTYRIGISLCYDIPLLNVTNTSKRSRKINF